MNAWNLDLVELLRAELAKVRDEIVALPAAFEAELAAVHPAHRASAENLLHYVALRCHDLREVQDGLASLGASSLGRAEAHVLDNVEAVLRLLHVLAGKESPPASRGVSAARGRAALRDHTDALLGPPPAGRRVRVMVTLPSEAAHDGALVRALVASGMDVARINCAHDGAAEWLAMIAHVRAAAREHGHSCRVLMDLAGPKVRTGELAPGPRVVSWRPRRGVDGRVLEPALVWLTARERPARSVAPTLPIPADALAVLKTGDRLAFEDARGKKRRLEVGARAPGGCWAHAGETAFVTPETRVRVKKRKLSFTVGDLPPLPAPLVLEPGERFLLSADPTPGTPAAVDAAGRRVSFARIPFTAPEVFSRVEPGQQVWLDDGKIAAIVRAASPQGLELEVKGSGPVRLGAQKGVNFPGADLGLPSLGEKDLVDLAFAAQHADLVGLSFVHSAADVVDLQAMLRERGRPDLGIILKIETRQGFERLPGILLAALRSRACGVMIARGDLAVECGYERLAEAQEEILWMCEAACVPVVWATQVLERLARKGQVTRSEVTDAAMGERAECVMLNKGPFVAEAVRVLDDILRRMEGHQFKKRSMLRALSVAREFGAHELALRGAP